MVCNFHKSRSLHVPIESSCTKNQNFILTVGVPCFYTLCGGAQCLESMVKRPEATDADELVRAVAVKNPDRDSIHQNLLGWTDPLVEASFQALHTNRRLTCWMWGLLLTGFSVLAEGVVRTLLTHRPHPSCSSHFPHPSAVVESLTSTAAVPIPNQLPTAVALIDNSHTARRCMDGAQLYGCAGRCFVCGLVSTQWCPGTSPSPAHWCSSGWAALCASPTCKPAERIGGGRLPTRSCGCC